MYIDEIIDEVSSKERCRLIKVLYREGPLYI